MTISTHTIVCNEERYIWYSLMSVANYVEKLIVWDTGSTDSTVEIIKEVEKKLGDKLEFRQLGKVGPSELTELRQKMLAATKSDWFIILDGDEVWWDSSIRKLVKTINRDGEKLNCLVSPYYNLIGDIYHYQEDSISKYVIDGRKGFLNIRAVNTKIPGLNVVNPYPKEAYVNENGIFLQEMPKKERKLVEAKYLHFTHLLRSGNVSKNSEATLRGKKYKYEIGNEFPLDFYYPEVFFRERPNNVNSVWEINDAGYYLRANVETALRKLKRKFMK
ncbi:MAG TPA: glycosyltransferase family 2 protein [Patescibacteria group bacterium]